MIKWIALFHMILGLSVIHFTFADDFQPLYRGTRAQAMGNAFTAVADDEEAIFYNPAGLAGIKGFSLNVLAVDAEASNDLLYSYPIISSVLNNPGLFSVNTLIGKHLYLRSQGTATLVLPGFGIAALADQQYGLRLYNTSLPQGTLGAQTTYGGQAGFGVSLFKLKKKKGELRFGMAGKVLFRSGGYQSLSLAQLLTLNSSSITSGLKSYGMGFGGDLGFQFLYQAKKNLTLLAGLAMTDLGDTSFSGGGELQKENCTMGIAAKYRTGDLIATLAIDYSHILDYMEWQKKSHMGLELKFPFLSLSAGLSQTYLTYGISFDVGIIKVSYVSYADELATLVNQNPERRTLVHAALKFEL